MYVTIERRDQDNLSTALVIVLCGSSLRKLQSVMHFSATLSSATKFFTALFTALSWVITASFTALSWVVPTLSWGVAGPFRKTTFDIRRPTAERRPTFNSRLSAVECRITVVGRRMSNAATIAITSTPICVCRYNWDTPGSSKTDCLRLSPSSPPPCASARRISDTSAHRWRQSRRRAPQGALLSDAP